MDSLTETICEHVVDFCERRGFPVGLVLDRKTNRPVGYTVMLMVTPSLSRMIRMAMAGVIHGVVEPEWSDGTPGEQPDTGESIITAMLRSLDAAAQPSDTPVLAVVPSDEPPDAA